ncbi:MAG: hypothetical protein LBO75_02940 [Bifidobacteriaceae bacterium]|jgi:hypothetical protein|nr:hypothetical protein [Bifidobacteriaceae bacterium]
MGKVHTASDGTALTEELLDKLEAEIETGQCGGSPGPVHHGRPLAVGSDAASPVTVRLDSARREKLRGLAARRHVSQAQVLRDLLDAATV